MVRRNSQGERVLGLSHAARVCRWPPEAILVATLFSILPPSGCHNRITIRVGGLECEFRILLTLLLPSQHLFSPRTYF